jgi:cephalosporin-C deacetylase
MSDDNNKINTGLYCFDPSYGYDLKQLLAIKPPREPKDFVSFWQNRYQNALQINPAIQVQKESFSQAGWQVFKMQYQSTEDCTIHGWLLLPESGIIKRAFVVGHGYGGREQPDFHLPFKDAALLFPCFRGLGLSRHATISPEPHWHVLHHIDDINRYVLAGCVEDVWLAVSSLLSLYPHLAGHLGYLGISFGGGIGALAVAWEQRLARAHFNAPTFGQQPLRLRLPSQGSANSVQNYCREHKKEVLKALSYYDAATAAKYIQQPIHCACALYDPCVAPPGQFAIYNALNAKRQLFVLEAGHHEYPNKYRQEHELLNELNTFFAPLVDNND